MWVQVKDYERNSNIISRCYTDPKSEEDFPMVSIDIFRSGVDLSSLYVYINICNAYNAEGLIWDSLVDEQDWVLAEKYRLVKRAKKLLNL